MMLVFGWSMVQSGRIAIARIFTKYETTVVSTAPADAAAAADNSVAMTPLDAEVHYTRGAVATYRQDTPTALKEYEEAVSLRPRDYYFWVELGLARDDSGDQPGALFAFNEAMKRAPYYSQPRWLRGNLLFRSAHLAIRRVERVGRLFGISAHADGDFQQFVFGDFAPAQRFALVDQGLFRLFLLAMQAQ